MEITGNSVQLVNANANILFTDTIIPGNCSMIHKCGSGLVTLRGATAQCKARFKIFFGGNVGLPTDADVVPIQLQISANGEVIPTSTMISTPTGDNVYNNVATEIFIEVPKCCCVQVSVKNTSSVAINIENANLIIERVA